MRTMEITSKVHFRKGRKGTRELQQVNSPEIPRGRLPRVTKLMALVIRFETLINEGHVADYAELPRLGHVTRARMTQIMNLRNLAPRYRRRFCYCRELDRDAIW